jgi:hypothetical protein
VGSGNGHALAPGALEQGGQVQAGHVLHRDEVGVLGVAQVEHLHDVRVRERDRDLGLVDEHLHELGVRRVLGQDALDDQHLLEAGHSVALGAVHLGHAAARDALEQLVLPVGDIPFSHRLTSVSPSLRRNALTREL